MGNKRVSVPASTRFEVFKRDGFRCQYCGASPPDALLDVDHIKPVSEGGTGELLNLVAACVTCSIGKAARNPDDRAAIERQRRQLEDLDERREQMNMMLEWQAALSSLEDEKLEHIRSLFGEKTGYDLTEHGRRRIGKVLRQHPFGRVLEALEAATEQYLEPKTGGRGYTNESVNKALCYIGRICGVMRDSEQRPYLRDLYYMRGIYRQRIGFHSGDNKRQVFDLLEDAHLSGVPLEVLHKVVCMCRNWDSFQRVVLELTEEGPDA